jgi:hypothetical protein
MKRELKMRRKKRRKRRKNKMKKRRKKRRKKTKKTMMNPGEQSERVALVKRLTQKRENLAKQKEKRRVCCE